MPSPPDFKEAAMCMNCRNISNITQGMTARCLKFDYLIVLDHVCSAYEEKEYEPLAS